MDIIKSLRLRYLSAGIVDEDRFSAQRWRAHCQFLALVAQNINNNKKKGKMVMCGGQVRWWTAWLPSRGRFCNWSVERFTSRRFGRQRQPVIVDGTKPTNISADITPSCSAAFFPIRTANALLTVHRFDCFPTPVKSNASVGYRWRCVELCFWWLVFVAVAISH